MPGKTAAVFISLQILFCSFCAAQDPLLIPPAGHAAAVISVQFSKDGAKVITLSEDGTAKLWDVASGKLLRDFIAGGDASIALVTLAHFSADGQKIITGYDNSSTSIWNLNSRTPTWDWLYSHIEGEPRTIMDQFSPDGKKVLLFDFDNNGHLYNAATKKKLLVLQGHKGKINRAAFSADGNKIATAAEDKKVMLWEGKTGRKLFEYKLSSESGTGLKFSADGSKLFILSDKLEILDAATGKKIALIEKFQSSYFNFFGQLSPDGNKFFEFTGRQVEDPLFASAVYDTLWVYDARNQSLLFYKTNLLKRDSAVYFTPDGKKIMGITQKNTVEMLDAATGKIIYELKGHTAIINNICFSADGKKIITGADDGNAIIWNAVTGKIIASLNGHTASISSVNFSVDGKLAVTGSADHNSFIWDADKGTPVSELKGYIPVIKSARFSADGKTIRIVTQNNTRIWNRETAVLSTEPLHSSDSLPETESHKDETIFSPDSTVQLYWGVNIINVQFLATGEQELNFGIDELIRHIQISPDNRYFIMTTKNNLVRLYEFKKRRFVATFYILNGTDFMVQLESGFYESTPNAARQLHYVTSNLKIISFEQLDVKYNRPDRVIEDIGRADTVLINSYRNAYYKRIKKLGVDTSSFRSGYAVPEADFVNRAGVNKSVSSENLSLHIAGLDSTYNLDRINVWINEVPVFGLKGKSIRSSNTKTIDITVPVVLSQGENRIETSVTNVNGTESYRMPMLVNYNPVLPQKENTYFIGIGIDKFSDSLYNLKYSTKDIRDLCVKLKAKFGHDIIIDTLFNENVTVNNVRALKQKLLNSTVNDKVIISYSGHGLLSKDYDYYLSTYTVNFAKPEANGLSYDELESLLDSIPARKKLMLIDACHSGEVDKDEFRMTQLSKAVLDSNNVVSKGGVVTNTDTTAAKLGLQNSFELMQNLFVNVGKSTGATIISAAAGTEFALEKGILKNGVFTYSVMEAMDKYPAMKISELKKIVGARVEQLTNGMQKPTSRNEAIAVDWNLW